MSLHTCNINRDGIDTDTLKSLPMALLKKLAYKANIKSDGYNDALKHAIKAKAGVEGKRLRDFIMEVPGIEPHIIQIERGTPYKQAGGSILNDFGKEFMIMPENEGMELDYMKYLQNYIQSSTLGGKYRKGGKRLSFKFGTKLQKDTNNTLDERVVQEKSREYKTEVLQTGGKIEADWSDYLADGVEKTLSLFNLNSKNEDGSDYSFVDTKVKQEASRKLQNKSKINQTIASNEEVKLRKERELLQKQYEALLNSRAQKKKGGKLKESPGDKEMIDGVKKLLRKVNDKKNREEMLNYILLDFKKEGVKVDKSRFAEEVMLKTGGKLKPLRLK